jgi:hypothetical protein
MSAHLKPAQSHKELNRELNRELGSGAAIRDVLSKGLEFVHGEQLLNEV